MRSLLSCLLLCACGGAPCTPCSVTYGAAPPAGDEVAIEWLAVADGTRLPTVSAFGDGLRARVVLDTGSNMNLWSEGALWLLSARRDDRVTDATDPEARSVSLQWFEPLRMSLGLRGLGDRMEAFGRPLDVLEQLGIAGLLSPQRIAPSQGGLRIDFGRSRLRVLSAPELERALREATPLEPICPTDDGTPLFGITIRADGRTRRVVVDTGSDGVVLHDPDGSWARERSRERRWFWALGGSTERPVVETELELAGVRRRVSASLLETTHCAEGQLGIDALEGCAVIVGRDRAALECR